MLRESRSNRLELLVNLALEKFWSPSKELLDIFGGVALVSHSLDDMSLGSPCDCEIQLASALGEDVFDCPLASVVPEYERVDKSVGPLRIKGREAEQRLELTDDLLDELASFGLATTLLLDLGVAALDLLIWLSS